MAFLGFVLQAAILLFMVYSGYTYQDKTMELNLAFIIVCPIALMIGSAVRHASGKSNSVQHGFFEGIKKLIGKYITGLVLAGVSFGIGMGLYYILVLQPAPGTGSY